MVTVREMIRRLKAVNVPKQVIFILKQDADKLADLNKEQLIKGYTSDGERVSPGYYFDSYAEEKYKLNPLPGLGTPDLKLTGDFYSGFTVTVSYPKINFNSTDSKALQLEYKYGIYIYGLTEENKKAYALGTFYENLKTYIENQTGLRFAA